MRVIAGEFRGRKLLPPEGDVTRPITDRVKQSLFDILAPRIEGSRVYDCFAGTGSMGLECLSRGASHATFFEADRSALTRLAANIQTLKVADRATIRKGDLFSHLAGPPISAKADLLFLDPPYRFLREQPEALVALADHVARLHLNPGALVVFRHDANDHLALPPLNVVDQREYGGMTLEFMQLPDRQSAIENRQ
ncbi:16S rRNA (guanine(966)-N(2))-methyltransferase RsmD [soil metagenome]